MELFYEKIYSVALAGGTVSNLTTWVVIVCMLLLFLQQDNREEQTIFKWEEEIQYGPQKGELTRVLAFFF